MKSSCTSRIARRSRAARVPHARAPALRAGARSRRRADSRRLRRRSAAPAARARTTTSTSRSSSSRAARSASPSRPPRSAACCRPRCCTCRARSGRKRRPATSCAAILQQPKTHAAQLLAEQGITRLDVLEYISHGITKTPIGDRRRSRRAGARRPAPATKGPRTARDPLAAYCVNLTDRARQGLLDPLIGRADELQRTIEVLCRRRKNNPVFVGDAGVGKTAMAEGLATRLLADDVQERAEGRGGLRARHRRAAGRHALPRRLRGALQGGHQGAQPRGRRPILFIDEIHSTVGAGAVTGGTMDLATLIKPILTAGDLRVIGSTTFEEFKHIEKDRALARRLQKIAIDEPSIEETVRILAGLRSRYEEHHRRDVHRRGARSRRQARRAAPARLPAARQRHRSHRRSRRGHAAEGRRPERRPNPDRTRTPDASDPVDRRRRRHRARRRAHGAHSGAPGVVVRSRAAADARGVARARGVRPARSRASGGAGDQAVARRPGPARSAGRLLPVHRARPASARPSSPSSWRSCSATSSSAST